MRLVSFESTDLLGRRTGEGKRMDSPKKIENRIRTLQALGKRNTLFYPTPPNALNSLYRKTAPHLYAWLHIVLTQTHSQKSQPSHLCQNRLKCRYCWPHRGLCYCCCCCYCSLLPCSRSIKGSIRGWHTQQLQHRTDLCDVLCKHHEPGVRAEGEHWLDHDDAMSGWMTRFFCRYREPLAHWAWNGSFWTYDWYSGYLRGTWEDP